MNHPAPSGLIWGDGCHISIKKTKNCWNAWYAWKICLMKFQTPATLINPHFFFSNGGVYGFRVPEFERRSAAGGMLAKMAASGHRGHFRDLQRQGRLRPVKHLYHLCTHKPGRSERIKLCWIQRSCLKCSETMREKVLNPFLVVALWQISYIIKNYKSLLLLDATG